MGVHDGDAASSILRGLSELSEASLDSLDLVLDGSEHQTPPHLRWLAEPHVLGVKVNEDDLWRVKDRVQDALALSAKRAHAVRLRATRARAEASGDVKAAKADAARAPLVPVLPDTVEDGANLVVVQWLLPICSWGLRGALLPRPGDEGSDGDEGRSGGIWDRSDAVRREEERKQLLEGGEVADLLLGVRLDADIAERIAQWEERFPRVFGSIQPPWNVSEPGGSAWDILGSPLESDGPAPRIPSSAGGRARSARIQ
jgi:hypothetical protein